MGLPKRSLVGAAGVPVATKDPPEVQANGLAPEVVHRSYTSEARAALDEIMAFKESLAPVTAWFTNATGGSTEEDDPSEDSSDNDETRLRSTQLRNGTYRFDILSSNESLYGESPWRRIAKNKCFENTTLSVISFNAIWIGVDLELNEAPLWTSAHPVFQVADNAFCIYFTLEVLVRYLAFQSKCMCWKDKSFMFDAFLVALMILETWVFAIVAAVSAGEGGGGLRQLSMLRLLRLLRLTRITRLIRAFPELMTLIKGLFAALRSVFTTFLFQVGIMWIFGIIFTQTYKNGDGDVNEFFRRLGLSILTLFVQGTLLDELTSLAVLLLEDSWIMLVVFFVFVLISSMTLLNMLIGVVTAVVSATANQEAQELAVKEATQTLRSIFMKVDKDCSLSISHTEFEDMLEAVPGYRQELMQLKTSEVAAKARELGVQQAQIVAAEESERPLGRLVDLCVKKAGEKLGPSPMMQALLTLGIQEDRVKELARQLFEDSQDGPRGRRRKRQQMGLQVQTSGLTESRSGGSSDFLRAGSMASELSVPDEDGRREDRRRNSKGSQQSQWSAKELSLAEFLDEIMMLKPGDAVSVRDLSMLRRAAATLSDHIENCVLDMRTHLEKLEVAAGMKGSGHKRSNLHKEKADNEASLSSPRGLSKVPTKALLEEVNRRIKLRTQRRARSNGRNGTRHLTVGTAKAQSNTPRGGQADATRVVAIPMDGQADAARGTPRITGDGDVAETPRSHVGSLGSKLEVEDF
eukprot:TRINITY_DN16423_c0_g1_i1.p1 TRINITY_DN16423_c0_g1~~TRINITY_DN16423_c0_g1_i1.p1  ORF type:complete len:749 (+),score=182.07 TRINITY_DN16423_c0_g1_i1:85-2331(+)